MTTNEDGVSFGWWECSTIVVMALQLYEYIKAIEFYILNGWIVCFINYT